MRLFVDVDDTLVIYDREGPNPYGDYLGIPWHPNERLIEGVKTFRRIHPEAMIAVWSGGGQIYARMWAERLGLGDITFSFIKDNTTFLMIQENDIVVDDQDLGGRRTHKPDEWPED